MFDFILIVRLAKENGFFGKKTDMEWGPIWIFFVKDTKNGGDHCKKLKKRTREAVIFVMGIEKIGVLHFSRVRFILS